MEVHHHTHSQNSSAGHAGKKFKHYIFEFFMLFLAVFCGFLAENAREQFVEHHREKQFINSLTEDIKLDIHNLDSVIKKREYREIMIDSLFRLLSSPDPDVYAKDIYYYARWLTYYYKFIINDRTIQQLKNSGNFRLISKQQVSDAIMTYDQEVRWIEPTTMREEVFIENYIVLLGDFFDSHTFDEMLDKKYGFHRPVNNPRLLNKDKGKLQKLMNAIHFFKAMNIFLMNWQTLQKNRAQQILEDIQKEYH